MNFTDPTSGAGVAQPVSGGTQLDPLDQRGDLRQANRYVYAGSNPVNHTDLTGMGLDVFEGLEIVGAAIGTGVVCAGAETGALAAACVGGAAGTSGLIGSSLKD